MAKLDFRGKTYRSEDEIRTVMAEFGVPYERWGVRGAAGSPDSAVLDLYDDEVQRLMKERAYESADLIALRPDTPNLDAIIAKFDKEHHHTGDEVRFTVEGEGVFEINTSDTERLAFTAEPGDLIVIPAFRRHLFYLTAKRAIRCIRLFKTKEGWEAIYSRPN